MAEDGDVELVDRAENTANAVGQVREGASGGLAVLGEGVWGAHLRTVSWGDGAVSGMLRHQRLKRFQRPPSKSIASPTLNAACLVGLHSPLCGPRSRDAEAAWAAPGPWPAMGGRPAARRPVLVLTGFRLGLGPITLCPVPASPKDSCRCPVGGACGQHLARPPPSLLVPLLGASVLSLP